MIAVSVIIPFHNRSIFFGRLFSSLSGISMDNVEIVLVDNNSSRDTRAVMEQLCGRLTADTTLSVSIIRETKRGAAAARNAGLRCARGEYVCFFDSDDEFSPELLPGAYLKAKKENSDVVAFRTNIVFPDGKVRAKRMQPCSNPGIQIVCNNFATQSFLLKRSFALDNGLWDETLYYWNDLEWGLRILLAKPKWAWLEGCYHRIHLHADSITGAGFSDRTDEIVHAHRAIHSDIMKFAQNGERERLLKSLNCRIAIYAGHICKETSKERSLPILSGIDRNVATRLHRTKLSLLYFLGSRGVPGLWRIALV